VGRRLRALDGTDRLHFRWGDLHAPAPRQDDVVQLCLLLGPQVSWASGLGRWFIASAIDFHLFRPFGARLANSAKLAPVLAPNTC
jgi:hypothetical protein